MKPPAKHSTISSIKFTMLVKVCGLRDPGNIRQVSAIQGVDLVGMIFYPHSPRFVDSQSTAQVVCSLTTVKVAGVFVNEIAEEVANKCEIYHLDYVQLHGSETPDYLTSLLNLLPSRVKLIKAFSVKTQEDLLSVSDFEGLCSYFLFDTPTSGYGGSGMSFDWHILQNYCGLTPFFLSGGIGSESLHLLKQFHHKRWAGIDLNSRFEIAPAQKNIPLLTDFVHQFKNIQT